MADPAAEAHGAHTASAHDAAAEVHAEVFPPLDASLFPSQLIWFAITFGALYYLVSRFVVPRVSAVLEKRAGTIKSDIDAAAKKSASAELARADMEKAVAKARSEARALVEAARADVTAKLTAEQAAAEARLLERISAAEAKVSAARAKALEELPSVAEGLARDIADRLAPAKA